MNRLYFSIIAALLCVAAMAENTINVYDHVTFYDGYLVERVPEDAPDEGCTRLYTYLNTKKLTDDQLNAIGEHLTLYVQVHPLCDNYDRIGSVNLALIPKGQECYTVAYNDTDPLRIEIARFITPFMDKNKSVQSVPYYYSVDYLSNVLRDADLREKYDFWLELMIFGVPYAANQQISGCAGCNDVFQGSLDLITDDTAAPLINSNVLVPINIRTADWRADRGLNNYNEACTDELGRTVKTYTFTVPKDCVDSRAVLVISNHGAGTNGEEYVRRMHYVYADDELKLEFKPGRTSCEPFRKYNTQSNGIYGILPRTDARWQSFSNWCPGDVIDNRFIELGAITAGEHTIRIEVPDAEFYGQDGYFPVSLFFQGDTEGMLPAGVESPIEYGDYTTTVRIQNRHATITSTSRIIIAELYSISGDCLAFATPSYDFSTASLDLNLMDRGIYIVKVTTEDGYEVHKIAYTDVQ